MRSASDVIAYDVFSSPGLVIDEKVVSSGSIPTAAEIRQWLLAERGTTTPA